MSGRTLKPLLGGLAGAMITMWVASMLWLSHSNHYIEERHNEVRAHLNLEVSRIRLALQRVEHTTESLAALLEYQLADGVGAIEPALFRMLEKSTLHDGVFRSVQIIHPEFTVPRSIDEPEEGSEGGELQAFVDELLEALPADTFDENSFRLLGPFPRQNDSTLLVAARELSVPGGPAILLMVHDLDSFVDKLNLAPFSHGDYMAVRVSVLDDPQQFRIYRDSFTDLNSPVFTSAVLWGTIWELYTEPAEGWPLPGDTPVPYGPLGGIAAILMGILGYLIVRYPGELEHKVREATGALRRSEKAIREKEERLQGIIASLDEVVWSYCPVTKKLLFLSPSAQKLHGIPREKFYRDPDLWFKVVHPEDVERFQETMKDVYTLGFARCQHRIVRVDGEVRWLVLRATGVRNEEGQIVRLDGIVSDITAEVTAKQELEESRRRLHDTVQRAPLILMAVDRDGRVTLAQGRSLAGLDIAPDELNGRTIEDVYRDYPDWIIDWRRALGGETFVTVNTFRGFIFETSYSPAFDANGNPCGALSVSMDVTARQHAEEELKQSEARFKTLSRAAHEGILIHRHGKVLDINEAFVRMSGYSREELIGRDALNLMAPEFRNMVRDRIANSTEGIYTAAGVKKDGTHFPIEVCAELIPYEGGTARVATIRDITLYEKAKQDILKAKEAAEEAARARSEFLANMSHEIRTPLNAILGLTQLLEKRNLPPRDQEYVRTIRFSSETLLGIITEILDFSKIDSGKLEIENVAFDLHETLEHVHSLFEHKARTAGLALRIDSPAELPRYHFGAPTRVRQILINLVGNAIKFTPDGAVVIEARMVEQHEDRSVITLAVHDTGIGIEPDKFARLFQPFSQVDASTTRVYGGTGLGLAISQRLAKAMGGRIEVESVPGKGSTFTLLLPLESASAEDLESNQTPPPISGEAALPMIFTGDRQLPINGNARQVLLVEDNAVNRMVASRMLEELGFHCDRVENGREALEVLRKKSYGLILMDCQMPVMDGYEATRRIRATGRRGRSVPIVAMTANSMKGDREKCLDAGMDDYLAKPITLEGLTEMLDKYLPGTMTLSAAEGNSASGDSGEKVIDESRLRQIAGDDMDVILQIVDIFLEDAAVRTESLMGEVDNGDLEEVRRQAHALKGASANIGAIRFSRAAERLEAFAKVQDRKASQQLARQLDGLLNEIARHNEHKHRAMNGGS